MLRKLTLLFLLFPLAAHAADMQNAFTWRSGLDGMQDPGSLHKVGVSPEVFDGCHAFPRDLRIMDDQGVQWPFYVWEAAARTRILPYPSDILNQSVAETPEPHLRIELKLDLGKNTDRNRHNQVKIQTPGADFIRRVEVLGSNDRQSWGLLSAGFLIDYRKPSRVTNDTIRYPQTDHPFLQIRIYANARDDKLPTRVTRIKVEGKQVQFSGEWEPVPLTLGEATKKDQEKGAEIFILDTGYAHRPMEKLILHTAPGDYFRPVRLYGRHTDTNRWRIVKNGEIHRVGEKEQNILRLSSCTYRHLKLAVYNYDDAPIGLEQITAEAVPRYLVFEAKSKSPAGLYYGSPRAAQGRYDLQRRKGPAEAEKAPRVALAPREENLEYRIPRLDPWLPWIGGSAVVLVSLVVIWIVVRMLKTGGWQEP